MKLSIAIADTNALPDAFVVFRGIKESIYKAAELGYHGVELALKQPGEIDSKKLDQYLKDTQLQVSCISTGQVYAGLGLDLCHEDENKREQAIEMLKSFIDLARDFGQKVNMGRVRGSIGKRKRADVEKIFMDSAGQLAQYAQSQAVTLLLEPCNRYEIDFINSVEEGVELVKKMNLPHIKVMADVFHMNIEDTTISGVLNKHIQYIDYIHFADSNRLAPGRGHTDFDDIIRQLKSAAYQGWLTIEILPQPGPDQAAKAAADHILALLEKHAVLG